MNYCERQSGIPHQQLPNRKFVGRFIWNGDNPIRERYPDAYLIRSEDFVDVYEWVDSVLTPTFTDSVLDKARIMKVEKQITGTTWREKCRSIRTLVKKRYEGNTRI